MCRPGESITLYVTAVISDNGKERRNIMKRNRGHLWAALFIMVLLLVPAKRVNAAELNKTSLTLYTGETFTLKVTDAEETPVFKSSKSTVASVDKKTGKISAKKSGKANIIVAVGDETLTCKVTVKKSIEVTDYLGKPYTKLSKAVGSIKQADASQEPVSYTGTLYYYTKGNELSDFFFRIDKKTKKITSLQNRCLKKVTFCGVRLGDKKSAAEKLLKKKGIGKTQTYESSVRYESSKYDVSVGYENGKVAWYRFLVK